MQIGGGNEENRLNLWGVIKMSMSDGCNQRITDRGEIEKIVIGMMHRDNSLHIWDILKTAYNKGISERLTKDVMDFFLYKKYIMVAPNKPRFYLLTKEGENYLAKVTQPETSENSKKTG